MNNEVEHSTVVAYRSYTVAFPGTAFLTPYLNNKECVDYWLFGTLIASSVSLQLSTYLCNCWCK